MGLVLKRPVYLDQNRRFSPALNVTHDIHETDRGICGQPAKATPPPVSSMRGLGEIEKVINIPYRGSVWDRQGHEPKVWYHACKKAEAGMFHVPALFQVLTGSAGLARGARHPDISERRVSPSRCTYVLQQMRACIVWVEQKLLLNEKKKKKNSHMHTKGIFQAIYYVLYNIMYLLLSLGDLSVSV